MGLSRFSSALVPVLFVACGTSDIDAGRAAPPCGDGRSSFARGSVPASRRGYELVRRTPLPQE